VPGLRALSSQERINTVRFWLCEAGVEPPSTARLTEALRQVFEAKVDHLPTIAWGNYALRRYRQRVFLTDAHPPRLEGTRSWSLAPESAVDLGPRLGQLRWAPHMGGIDTQRLPASLGANANANANAYVSVRRRGGGESLKPAAQARTRSVQHLCQSQGVLPWMRDALPLVFAGEALIAVADLWLDAQWCAAPGQPGLGIIWEGAPIIV
jgi:tRNA(Ile)-lysidine synthase